MDQIIMILAATTTAEDFGNLLSGYFCIGVTLVVAVVWGFVQAAVWHVFNAIDNAHGAGKLRLYCSLVPMLAIDTFGALIVNNDRVFGAYSTSIACGMFFSLWVMATFDLDW